MRVQTFDTRREAEFFALQLEQLEILPRRHVIQVREVSQGGSCPNSAVFVEGDVSRRTAAILRAFRGGYAAGKAW